MDNAIQETERRRQIQWEYNQKHGITPQPIEKQQNNSILAFLDISRRLNAQQLEQVYEQADDLPLDKIPQLVEQLESEMKEAAENLEFEKAANLRDRVKKLREKLLRN
jgi:excinuclease ABC subunit B